MKLLCSSCSRWLIATRPGSDFVWCLNCDAHNADCPRRGMVPEDECCFVAATA